MTQDNRPPASGLTAARILIQVLFATAVLVALLFLPAGRWDWPEAWAFVACQGAFLLSYAFYVRRKSPGLLEERRRPLRTAKGWDRKILLLYAAILPLVFVVAGFDAGRYRWSAVPFGAIALAWAALAGSATLIFWTFSSNPFLSHLARVQDDRGHVVVTSGPYRHVRHPMYLGILVLFLFLPAALASWWALVPGLAIDFLFVIRTAREDAMLREELPGYGDYAERVRFRLIPGLW